MERKDDSGAGYLLDTFANYRSIALDRKLKKKERKNMKILDLKKTAVILVTMLLFLSMQISAFASDNRTVVKIPVRQIFDSEVEIADGILFLIL